MNYVLLFTGRLELRERNDKSLAKRLSWRARRGDRADRNPTRFWHAWVRISPIFVGSRRKNCVFFFIFPIVFVYRSHFYELNRLYVIIIVFVFGFLILNDTYCCLYYILLYCT